MFERHPAERHRLCHWPGASKKKQEAVTITQVMYQSDHHPGLLLFFVVSVLVLLLLDLGVFHREKKEVTNKSALVWSVIWIGLAMAFSVFVYRTSGFEKFSQFQSAYWIEKALSVDNLFVFLLIFSHFKLPRKYEHKALFWGIIGAIVLRAIFIFLGVDLIRATYLPPVELFGKMVSINLVLCVFGFFLIYAGIKSWFNRPEEEKNFDRSVPVLLIRKIFRVADSYDEDKFFTIRNGKRYATRFLMVVAVIEFSDLLFAIDSIPAIFAIAPNDPFILYTSNIFAILGLRSLYFLLANSMHLFSKLKYGLAIILVFIGLKMIVSPFYHLETKYSLAFLMLVLMTAIGISLASNKKEGKKKEI